MTSDILSQLANLIINFISGTGYVGIFILMTVESALIPIPSEITMPFAGFLASRGELSLLNVSLIGALGNLIGSLLAYALGYWGQEKVVRVLIRKYGRFILLSEHDLDVSENWFRKYGNLMVFVSRLLPALRTVISLPAGIAKLGLPKFIFYTTLGSFIWSYLLAYIGFKLGENWNSLGPIFHKFDLALVILGIAGIVLYVYHKREKIKGGTENPVP